MQQQSKLSQTIALIKRALFRSPRRLIGYDYTMPSFIIKIKNFVSRLSPSILLLWWSIVLLIYAIVSSIYTPKDYNMHHNSWAEKTPLVISDSTHNESITRDKLIDIIMTNTQDIGTIYMPNINTEESTWWEWFIQVIYDLYNAMNDGTYTVEKYFDNYMRRTTTVQQYFTPTRIEKLIAATTNGISVDDVSIVSDIIQNRIHIDYRVSYTLQSTQQTFTEDWSVILRNQWWWKIGTIRCETRWCSTHPIFNPARYGIR